MKRRRRSSQADISPALSVHHYRLLAGAVLLLALALAVCAARMVPAGIASYQALSFMAHWRKAGEEPSARAYEIARTAAQRSVTLYPVANGQYLQQLGLVEQWQAFRQPFAAPQAGASRQASLQALRQAVAARPTWPAAWVDLAWAKLYLQEFDSEFAQALQQAAGLGPWRIGINRGLSQIGFYSWPRLDAEQRELVLESARRTVSHSRREALALFDTAKATGLAEDLCSALPGKIAEERGICAGTIK